MDTHAFGLTTAWLPAVLSTLERIAGMHLLLAWIAAPILAIAGISAVARPGLAPRWERCGSAGAGLMLAALLLHTVRAIAAHAEMPIGVWLLGLIVWPVVMALGATSLRIAAGLLWLLCAGAVPVWMLDRWWSAGPLIGALYVAGALACLVSLYGQWRTPCAPEQPPEPPDRELVEHLDAERAREGADKYTRE